MSDNTPQLDISALLEEMACEYGRLWAAGVQARMVIRQQAAQLAESNIPDRKDPA